VIDRILQAVFFWCIGFITAGILLSSFSITGFVVIPLTSTAPATAGATPTPAPTPTPDPEKEKERLHHERRNWDHRKKLNPNNGLNQREKTLETAGSVVEFSFPIWKSHTFAHICCGCALTHGVSTQVVLGPLGFPWLHMRWEVDDRATHRGRMRKFGINYWQGDPLSLNR